MEKVVPTVEILAAALIMNTNVGKLEWEELSSDFMTTNVGECSISIARKDATLVVNAFGQYFAYSSNPTTKQLLQVVERAVGIEPPKTKDDALQFALEALESA